MYRLLIVDDEEIIANGLYEIFRSFASLDLDVYRAYSGQEAIEWLNRTRIDIVLTDIRMPVVDGFQLLDEIYKRWPRCRVVFLTGHSEFEYVYKAIQHPGVSYVLKSEDHAKVVKTVETVMDEIRRELKTEDLIRKAKDQMSVASELFQKDFFVHLLRGEAGLTVDQGQFDRLGIPLDPGRAVLLALGNADALPPEPTYWDRVRHLYSIRQIIGQYVAPHVNSAIVLDDDDRFVLFVQPAASAPTGSPSGSSGPGSPSASYEKAFNFLRGTLESIQMACREALGIPVSFVIAATPCPWEALSGRFVALNHLINFRIGQGRECLLVQEEVARSLRDAGLGSADSDAEAERLETVLRKKPLSIIEHYLESGQQGKFFDILDEVLVPMRKITVAENAVAVQAFHTVSLALLSYINRWRPAENPLNLLDRDRLMRPDRFDSWEQAAAYLSDAARKLFDSQNEAQNRRADDTVAFLRKFVADHLAEDLSLVRLAEQVCLNPSYLSRLYKQVTGGNLSEFIEGERIRKAKQLLEDSRVKILEVARSVGYENAASFTRVFRKAAGIAPQDYRDAKLMSHIMHTK